MGMCKRCSEVFPVNDISKGLCESCTEDIKNGEPEIKKQKQTISSSNSSVGIFPIFGLVCFLSSIIYLIVNADEIIHENEIEQENKIVSYQKERLETKDKGTLNNTTEIYEDYKKRYDLAVSFSVLQEDKCKLAKQVLEKARLQNKYPDAVKVWTAIEYGACSLVEK